MACVCVSEPHASQRGDSLTGHGASGWGLHSVAASRVPGWGRNPGALRCEPWRYPKHPANESGTWGHLGGERPWGTADVQESASGRGARQDLLVWVLCSAVSDLTDLVLLLVKRYRAGFFLHWAWSKPRTAPCIALVPGLTLLHLLTRSHKAPHRCIKLRWAR